MNLDSDTKEKLHKFLDYNSQDIMGSGMRSSIGDIRKHLGSVNVNLEILNKNISEANNSSTQLAKALNRITSTSVAVAIIGLLITLFLNISYIVSSFKILFNLLR